MCQTAGRASCLDQIPVSFEGGLVTPVLPDDLQDHAADGTWLRRSAFQEPFSETIGRTVSGVYMNHGSPRDLIRLIRIDHYVGHQLPSDNRASTLMIASQAFPNQGPMATAVNAAI